MTGNTKQGLAASFSGALQASLAVILTLFYGFLAARFHLMKDESARDVSKLCVKIFLPALVITNVGSQLCTENLVKYFPVFMWSAFYTFVSMAYGKAAEKIFRLPSWTSAACTFNNTTSLPLLLVHSLAITGFLDSIAGGDVPNAVERAKSFFLMNSMLTKAIAFALGPKLLNHRIYEKDRIHHKKHKSHVAQSNGLHSRDVESGAHHSPARDEADHNSEDSDERLLVGVILVEETPDVSDIEEEETEEDETEEEQEEEQEEELEEELNADEHTHLLPSRIRNPLSKIKNRTESKLTQIFHLLPRPIQSIFKFLHSLINPPLVGAFIAVIIGLSPPLHRAFFGNPQDGGIFTAWFTSSIKHIGEIFTALQMFIVGTKLSASFDAEKRAYKFKKKSKSRKNSSSSESVTPEEFQTGKVPLSSMVIIFLLRFILWPIISIAIIVFLAYKTNLLSDDPILWFSLILMPTGPPAIILASLAELSGSRRDKLSVAKLLTISYAVTPVICFGVVGAVKGCEWVMERKR